MRALRAALRLVALGLAAGACSGLGAGACAPRPVAPAPVASPSADGAATVADEALAVRIRDLHARLDAPAADEAEFGPELRSRRRIRDAVVALIAEVTDPERRRTLGIEELALRVEKEYREFLVQRVPGEAHRRLEAAVFDKALEPAVAGGTAAFEDARRYIVAWAKTDLIESMAREFEAEEDAAEFDRLLALQPSDRTGAEAERVRRFSNTRRAASAELSDILSDSGRTGAWTTSYGSGTAIVAGRRDAADSAAPDPGAWWESATAGERKEWLLSWLADKGTHLQVLKIWDEPCGACGTTTPPISGAEAPVPAGRAGCRDCGGCGVIRKVRWR